MFDQFIRFQARLRPEAPAVIMPGRAISFAGFDDDVSRVADALGVLDVGRGEPVAVDIADPYHHWLVTIALARRGIASAPGLDTTCRLRISESPALSGTAGTLHAPPAWFEAALAGPGRPHASFAVERTALGRVFRSSGTTGESKRVGLSWAVVEAIIRNAPIAYGASSDGRWLALTGPSTILGFALALGAWALGHAVILIVRVDAEDLERYQPTLIGMVPYQLQDLLARLPDTAQPRAALRIVTGGSHLPGGVAREARRRLTPDIRSVYGASECSAVAVADSTVLDECPDAAGFILPGVEVEIVDDEDCRQRDGGSGRIRIRSDRVAGGYLEGPVHSASTFRDGWFYPGDMGRMGDNGLLIVEGRADDLMNLGGDKVLPGVIEHAVADCPGVADVAAFSMPDQAGLQRCWLAVVPSSTGVDRDLIQRRVSERLPWLDQLVWVIVNAIPRNAMGKIQRDQLRAAAQQMNRPAL